MNAYIDKAVVLRQVPAEGELSSNDGSHRLASFLDESRAYPYKLGKCLLQGCAAFDPAVIDLGTHEVTPSIDVPW
ncbi:hypothetical protein I5G39_034485 (plasmid) [Pseudomonas aeruginosa]|uniref:hypothetical protein n=1 Tax=Pseudomonas aeruginosa TaxID=287 RepID=UPI001A342B81|nr:hypothetical protein [Pseudomonas aeruginosa]MBG6979028.1 hypothetical protein [Pseudomonas aeruginosa]